MSYIFRLEKISFDLLNKRSYKQYLLKNQLFPLDLMKTLRKLLRCKMFAYTKKNWLNFHSLQHNERMSDLFKKCQNLRTFNKMIWKLLNSNNSYYLFNKLRSTLNFVLQPLSYHHPSIHNFAAHLKEMLWDWACTTCTLITFHFEIS